MLFSEDYPIIAHKMALKGRDPVKVQNKLIYGRFRRPGHKNQSEKFISALFQLQMSVTAEILMRNCTQKQATAPVCSTPKEATATIY
jgi:hypothetical protein